MFLRRLPDGASPKERHKPSEWPLSTPRNEPTWQYAYSYAISTYSEKIPSSPDFHFSFDFANHWVLISLASSSGSSPYE